VLWLRQIAIHTLSNITVVVCLKVSTSSILSQKYIHSSASGPRLGVCKPVYCEQTELVPKPGNMKGCDRKGIQKRHKHTFGCMAGLTVAVLGVAASGLLVVMG